MKSFHRQELRVTNLTPENQQILFNICISALATRKETRATAKTTEE